MLTACSQKPQKDLRIATNAWIGYAPLFYAKEKGYLKDLNIKLINTVSLGEASDIFNVGQADMVTITQHEYNALKKISKTLTPILLLDRSYGGDMILSNKNINDLQNASKIYAYLEVDSINTEMIQSFTAKYHIKSKNIVYINKDQAQIAGMQFATNHSVVVVTYAPYDIPLKKQGLNVIASTKDIDTIMVIDSICTIQETLQQNYEKITKLKKILDKSILEIQNDTKGSHALIAKYLGNINYQEYLSSLQSIKWINKPSVDLLNAIDKIGYKRENLIQ